MTHLTKPIALIGLSGSGKTTFGEILAKELEFKFIDTDQLISKNLNDSIDNIFTNHGESFFREQENNVLQNLPTNKSDYILSTGGGIIINADNLRFLLDNFIVIHVKCDLNIIAERLKNDNSRPLIMGDPIEKLNFLFTQRQHFYNKAHIEIDTSSNDIKKIIKDTTNALEIFHET